MIRLKRRDYSVRAGPVTTRPYLAARIHILGAMHSLTITVHERLIALLQTMGCTEEAAQLDGAQPRSVDLLREVTLDRSSRSMEQSAAMASVWRSVLPVCLSVTRWERSSKAGKIDRGVSDFAAVRVSCTLPPSQVSGNPIRRAKPRLWCLRDRA